MSLSSGFWPDPQTVERTSGGSVDVGTLGLGSGCGGYVTSAPDYRVLWSGTSSRLRIFFISDGEEDTRLIINDANGNWHCNDDSPYGTLNPLADISNSSSGQYDIWVASYGSGDYVGGTLYITEFYYHPGDLP